MASEKGEAVIKKVIEAIGKHEGMGYELSKAEVTLEWQLPSDAGDAPSNAGDAPFETGNGWDGERRSHRSTFMCCYRNGIWTCDVTPCDG